MFKTIITSLLLIGFFATLLSLGFWQLNRLAWKNDVIAKIQAQESIDPMTTAIDLSNTDDFQRGYLKGQFVKNAEFIKLQPRTHDGKVGYHVLRPFVIADMNKPIMVNMGWVENGSDIEAIQFSNVQKIAGYMRSPDPRGTFTPNNFPMNNQWYWMDMNAVNDLYKLNFHSQILYLESPQSSLPQTFSGLPQPRNKHIQYALFWFFMAGLLPILVILVRLKK